MLAHRLWSLKVVLEQHVVLRAYSSVYATDAQCSSRGKIKLSFFFNCESDVLQPRWIIPKLCCVYISTEASYLVWASGVSAIDNEFSRYSSFVSPSSLNVQHAASYTPPRYDAHPYHNGQGYGISPGSLACAAKWAFFPFAPSSDLLTHWTTGIFCASL